MKKALMVRAVRIMRLVPAIFVVVVFMFTTSAAFAGALRTAPSTEKSPPPILTSFQCKKGGLGKILNSFSTTMQGSGIAIARRAIAYGQVMLRGFLLVALMWYGVMMMFDVGGRYAEPQSLMRNLMTWGFVFFVFYNYSQIYTFVNQAVTQAGDGLAGAVPDGTSQSATCLLTSIQVSLLRAATTASPFLNVSIGSLFGHIGATASAILGWLAMAGALLVSAIILLAATLVYYYWTMVFSVYLAIAFGLGPLFIPTMIFDWTQGFLFDPWLKFLWSALMYKLVGPTILALISTIIVNSLGHMATSVSLYTYVTHNGTKFLSINLPVVESLASISAIILVLMIMLPSLIGKLASGAIGDVGGVGIVKGAIGSLL